MNFSCNAFSSTSCIFGSGLVFTGAVMVGHANAQPVGEITCTLTYTDCYDVEVEVEWTCNSDKQCCHQVDWNENHDCINGVSTGCCESNFPGQGGLS